MYVCSIISGKTSFSKKTSSRIQTLHIKPNCTKIFKNVKELWTSKFFFRDSSYCSTYFEILNPVPRQSTSFSYTFSCHFKGLYLCVYTQNTRTSQGKIFRHSIPNHDGSKPVMMMKNEGLCFCTLKRFDGIFLIRFIYSEKVKKFCENFTLLLSYVVPAKSKVKISQNFVAFLEYMNFNVIIITMAGQFIYNFQSPVTFWINRQKYESISSLITC